MDIEAFSDDSFDAVAWINATFKQPDATYPSKDARVSATVSKLQLYVQQLNAALEDTSQQVLAGMPRIMRDAQHLQTEAQSLRSKMLEVQTDIAAVQRETGAGMEHLERLDGLQTKLRAAKQGLQESDGWGRLTGELEDLLEQNSDLVQAQDKLQALQKSLAAQAGLAGQSERDAQLEGFKNRIEALASPGVVDAFTVGDVDAARRHVRTFGIMQRVPQLQQYYRTVQRNQLQQFWTELLETNSARSADDEAGSNTTTAGSVGITFLRDFYEHLVAHWQRQLKWCAQVFGDVPPADAQATLVLCELLDGVQPSREQAVNACLKRTGDRLAVLSDISAANVWFVGAMQQHYCGVMATGDEAAPFVAPRLCASICDWFQPFVAQYAAVEQALLAGRLAELPLQLATSGETVRALGAANGKVCEWLEQACKRCEAITQDCGLPALVIVIGGILKTFLDKYRKAQQQLHAGRTIEQNWSILQSCIALLQHLGDFRQQLGALEQRITDAVFAKQLALAEPAARSADAEEHQRPLCANGRNAYAITGKRGRREFAALVEECGRRANLAPATDSDAEIAPSSSAAEPIPSAASTTPAAGGGLFRAARDQIIAICEYVHDTTLASVFAPIEAQMQTLAAAEALQTAHGGDLPAYSFAPQEFITEVGQYLLMLPQHLEPVLLRPAPALREALELCDERYQQPHVAGADVLLALLVDETCAMYEEQIGRIGGVSAAGAKQLATDVEYLGSVLEELGLGLGTRLQQTVTLLRAAPESYLALSAGCDPKLVTGIRQMRNIASME